MGQILIGSEAIADVGRPLQGTRDDYDPFLELVGNARVVLLGEASHGTHEFYRERARITKRLIQELDFTAVAIEGDWPDAYRVNRYIRAQGADATADEALSGFRRFPAWMWRNTVALDFVRWLRAHNDVVRGREPETGFYGLDLYSLHASMEAVLGYLDRVDPEAARRARQRYGCFELFGTDPQQYGFAATLDLRRSCEDEAVRQLLELQQQRDWLTRRNGLVAEDEYFHAEQNARVVQMAERYYRVMFRGQVASWNLRDTHMADTLAALLDHLDSQVGRAKVVVWAHNSHVGDARATEMGDAGELNLGQLARQRYEDDVVNLGFTTYTGTVTAARDWGEPPVRRRVVPGLAGSYEELLHDAGFPQMLLNLREEAASEVLHLERLQRAIGVIYRPETERRSHYFFAHLADQFDALVHWDETRALDPLEPVASPDQEEAPETWPTGL
jgi:erythromycin esterase-like protein